MAGGDGIMANALIQFRTDDTSKIKAANICERLGIDLPTYMRMCISRLIQENGIPFSMKLDEKSESRALKAMKSASRIAEEHGISDMSLEEIIGDANFNYALWTQEEITEFIEFIGEKGYTDDSEVKSYVATRENLSGSISGASTAD